MISAQLSNLRQFPIQLCIIQKWYNRGIMQKCEHYSEKQFTQNLNKYYVLIQILCYMFKMFYSWQEIYDSDVSFVDWPSKGWNANIWAFKHQRALCLFCLDLEMLKSLSEAELFSFSVPLCGEYFCIAEYFRCKESKFVWCKLANLWRLLKLKLLAYLVLWKYFLQWKCDTWIFGALQMW